jgi:hypothetical protein
MTVPNDFSEYYRTISNTELLGILENPDDYQPLALGAAREELDRRQLSDTAIREAKEPLIARRLQQKRQSQKVKATADKAKNYGYALVDLLNPIQSGIPSTEKIIRLIVVVYSAIFLYTIITGYQTIRFFIEDIPRFPLAAFVELFPLLLLPAAVFIFWKRKPAGWMLLTIHLLLSVAVAIWSLLLSFSPQPYSHLFTRPPATTYFIQLLFFGGTLYAIGRKDVRKVFFISGDRIGATIALAFALILFFFFAMYSSD